MTFQLKMNGIVLAEHPTRLQCVIEAIERGLAVTVRQAKAALVDGAKIVEVG